jgi:hypothetical protein
VDGDIQTDWEENYGDEEDNWAQDGTHCPQDGTEGGACYSQDGTEGGARYSQDGTEGRARYSQGGTEGGARCPQDGAKANSIATRLDRGRRCCQLHYDCAVLPSLMKKRLRAAATHGTTSKLRSSSESVNASFSADQFHRLRRGPDNTWRRLSQPPRHHVN